VPAAVFLGRILIFFHDCVHSSFFASRRANAILGRICGILTFTPYEDWRRAHGIHHATVGDLDRRGVGDFWLLTVIAILAIIVAASLTIGFRTYVLIHLPVILICGAMAMWMFYVQHQFDSVLWSRHDERDPIRIALEGSPYYRLPGILQWMTGNIGYHHIHHIRPGIPDYNLQRCYDETPAMQAVKPLTIRESLRSPFLYLWDEGRQRIVGFRSRR